MSERNTAAREARRQQLLLGALESGTDTERLAAWLGDTPVRQQRGLRAYRINAAASAERALATAFPTVAALIGAESFAALARDLWRQRPPERGDLGEWGAALPDFIAESPSLSSEPYLADSARLDWLVHLASRAADAPDALPSLDALATIAPEALKLGLRPGTGVLASAWPVVSIWLAHQAGNMKRATAATGLRQCATHLPKAVKKPHSSGATVFPCASRPSTAKAPTSPAQCWTALHWPLRSTRPARGSHSTNGSFAPCNRAASWPFT